jgi:hypothetical protein
MIRSFPLDFEKPDGGDANVRFGSFADMTALASCPLYPR